MVCVAADMQKPKTAVFKGSWILKNAKTMVLEPQDHNLEVLWMLRVFGNPYEKGCLFGFGEVRMIMPS